MAGIVSECPITMQLATIWHQAHTIETDFNPILSIHEIPLYMLRHQVVTVQIEFHTQNGEVYCFCLECADHDLILVIRQEFYIGSTISKAICQYACDEMAKGGINHRLYLDQLHSQRIFILMSPRPGFNF
jgi:hypothetical protein